MLPARDDFSTAAGALGRPEAEDRRAARKRDRQRDLVPDGPAADDGEALSQSSQGLKGGVGGIVGRCLVDPRDAPEANAPAMSEAKGSAARSAAAAGGMRPLIRSFTSPTIAPMNSSVWRLPFISASTLWARARCGQRAAPFYQSSVVGTDHRASATRTPCSRRCVESDERESRAHQASVLGCHRRRSTPLDHFLGIFCGASALEHFVYLGRNTIRGDDQSCVQMDVTLRHPAR